MLLFDNFTIVMVILVIKAKIIFNSFIAKKTIMKQKAQNNHETIQNLKKNARNTLKKKKKHKQMDFRKTCLFEFSVSNGRSRQ